jgi:hypothetical protein
LRYADLIRATYLDIRDRLFAPPMLCNTDGDPLLFHTLTFRIESAEAAFNALAALAVGHSREELLDDAELSDDGKLGKVDIDWIKEGNRKFKTWVGLGLRGSDLLPGSCEIPLRAVLVPARLSYDPVRNWMVNWIAPLGERIIIE